jgi:uncharacterized membrane protein YfcA
MTALLSMPDDLSFAVSCLMISASFFTSMLTAVFGVGGGLSLLALMAQLLPVSAVIPIHAVVQAGSNAGRSVLLFSHAQWRFLLAFTAGAAVGAYIGGHIVITMPQRALQGTLAAFIFFMIWGPALPQWAKSQLSTLIQGLISSVLTMFVGATGPFLLAAMKPHAFSPLQKISTFAIAMTVQHSLKIAAFAGLGFAFRPYLGLMACMIITGFFGTVVGTKVLRKRDPVDFERWLKLILTLLAMRLAYVAFTAAS